MSRLECAVQSSTEHNTVGPNSFLTNHFLGWGLVGVELPRERFSRVLGIFSSLEVKVLYPPT
jgi:hypothetical protein